MAKATNTNSKNINDNFEALKAQMMKKRLKAEEAMEQTKDDEDVTPQVEATVTPKRPTPSPRYEDEYTVDSYNEESAPKYSDGYLHVEVPQNKPSVQMNKIIIKKLEKPEQPKRITYYLRPETIKKIDLYSEMAGMGKSEFVQNILDTVLNNLEVEE